MLYKYLGESAVLIAVFCVAVIPFGRAILRARAANGQNKGIVLAGAPDDQKEVTDYLINGFVLFAALGIALRVSHWVDSQRGGFGLTLGCFVGTLALAYLTRWYCSRIGTKLGLRLPTKRVSRFVDTYPLTGSSTNQADDPNIAGTSLNGPSTVKERLPAT